MSVKKSHGSLFRTINALAIILIVSFTISSQAQTEANEEYTVIDWNDLVPASWRRPLIDPDPSEHHHVDKKSLALKLDKQNIKLAGYMLPIKFTSNVVSEFVLMPFLKIHVKAHVHHEPNQMIYVKLSQPLEVTNLYSTVWVSSQLQIYPKKYYPERYHPVLLEEQPVKSGLVVLLDILPENLKSGMGVEWQLKQKNLKALDKKI